MRPMQFGFAALPEVNRRKSEQDIPRRQHLMLYGAILVQLQY